MCLGTTCVLASQEARERVLDALELELEPVKSLRVLGPLEEQPAILTTELFLQPFSIVRMVGREGHVVGEGACTLECGACGWLSCEISLELKFPQVVSRLTW